MRRFWAGFCVTGGRFTKGRLASLAAIECVASAAFLPEGVCEFLKIVVGVQVPVVDVERFEWGQSGGVSVAGVSECFNVAFGLFAAEFGAHGRS